MECLQRSATQTSHAPEALIWTTYQRWPPENLLAPLRQIDRRHANLPASITPIDLRAQRPADNLMTETDADDANPLLIEDLLDEAHQLQDPRVISEGVVLGSRDQDGVDVVKRGIFLRRNDVEDAEIEAGRGGEAGMLQGVGAGAQELGEDAAIASVFAASAVEGRVALQYGYTEGKRGHLMLRVGPGRNNGEGTDVERSRLLILLHTYGSSRGCVGTDKAIRNRYRSSVASLPFTP